ncbi:MAG: NAD-dependent epimerase/dehydratase family protein [Myxococcales bacterium]|nr:NAD-dependent epimerase/dehydratase family protein [Myxococcales bacterium]MCB9550369.1 NAD-dependent epimerase/dehydratase family protein [Myxococcales bacterium]
MIRIGQDLVLVTGATGFIGSHVVAALLDRGHRVRATVRDPNDAARTAHLRRFAEADPGRLTLVAADLMDPASLEAAVAGSAVVVHTAAVARMAAPDPQRAIVDPSVEGINNVLSAVRKAGAVRRVVHTSSVATLPGAGERVIDERDWNTDSTLRDDPYGLAKTTAERSLWQFAEAVEGVEVVALLPSMVFGPVFTRDHLRTSPGVLRDLLVGTFPAVPRIHLNVVDARDVALAHALAVEKPGVAGRFIVSREGRWMRELALDLARLCPAYKIRTGALPDLLMYAAAVFDPRLSLRTARRLLGRAARFDNRRSREVLGLDYRPLDETLRDAVESMVALGLAAPKRR